MLSIHSSLYMTGLNIAFINVDIIIRNYFTCKVKVKCTLVQALRLCTGRMAHRGSRGIALLFLDHGH